MKEKAYESIQHLPSRERVLTILERTRPVMERLRKEKARQVADPRN